MTLDSKDITGGIPPDPDQVVLSVCSYRGCGKDDRDEPLVVVAAVGKMATLCREHYDLLTWKGT